MSEAKLLNAIYDDDHATVKNLLRADPTLAARQIAQPKLYTGKLNHWIYTGDIPLHLAAAGHRSDIVQMLLDAGADPNSAANHRRSTPLHYASDGCPGRPTWNAQRQVQTIQSLLDSGANINAQDKNGATPLHRAVRTRCAAAVQHLLKAGCDASLKNKPGSTAFHLAVQNTGRGGSGAEEAKIGQRQIIETFLSSDANINARDGNGKTVLDCATSDWIRELLQARS